MSVEPRPEYLAALLTALDAFHAIDLAHATEDDDADDGAVHHLFHLDLDSTAAVWAVDEAHAIAITGALRELLRLLLQDDELELEVEIFASCERTLS